MKGGIDFAQKYELTGKDILMNTKDEKLRQHLHGMVQEEQRRAAQEKKDKLCKSSSVVASATAMVNDVAHAASVTHVCCMPTGHLGWCKCECGQHEWPAFRKE